MGHDIYIYIYIYISHGETSVIPPYELLLLYRQLRMHMYVCMYVSMYVCMFVMQCSVMYVMQLPLAALPALAAEVITHHETVHKCMHT